MRNTAVNLGLILLCVCTLLCACTPSSGPSGIAPEDTTDTQTEEQTTEGETDMTVKAPIYPISYQGIETTMYLTQFVTEVDNPDGSHNNGALIRGAIISPYFTMQINGTEVPCYTVRTARGAHTFAMIDATDDSFPLDVSVSAKFEATAYQVMPLHYGVTAQTNGRSVSTSIPTYGNYTLVPDDDIAHALTIFARAKEEYQAPEGYEVIKVAPGTHDEALEFTAEKQVMYFEAGVHEMRYALMFKSNTEVYFEPGAYIIATMPDAAVETPLLNPDWAGMPSWCALFQGQYVSNVRISGRGLIDLTKLDWHARPVIQFDQCENITVEGVTLNNSPAWTLYFTQSKNVVVDQVMLFGYRQNSDGIAIVDTANAVVKNCFARAGDDLFEVKSMYGNCDIKIENIVFENNNAWPDKCRGMGIIAESTRDMTDIHFIGGSVAYAPAEWMDDLGALIIYLEGKSKVTDVSFEGVEVYSSAKYPINVTLHENSTAQIDGLTFKEIVIHCDGQLKLQNRSTKGGVIDNVSFIDCVRSGKICNTRRSLDIHLDGVDKTIISYGEKE